MIYSDKIGSVAWAKSIKNPLCVGSGVGGITVVFEQSYAARAYCALIDGDGKVFWDSYWALRREYDPKGLRWAADYDCKRPRLIQVFDSEKITTPRRL